MVCEMHAGQEYCMDDTDPQVFSSYPLVRGAYDALMEHPIDSITDDAMVVGRSGISP